MSTYGPETPSASPSGGGHRPSAAVYRRRRLVAAALAVVLFIILIALIVGMINMFRGGSDAQNENNQDNQQEDVAPVEPTATPGNTEQPDVTTEQPTDPASPGGGTSPSPTSTPAPSPSPTAPEAASCDPGKITVEAATNKRTYAPGENAMFSMRLTNENNGPCEMNVGTSQMEFVVFSGNERIFSSKDCQQNAQENLKRIAPNGTETANFPWSRERSTADCGEAGPDAAPGSYRLQVNLGDRTSEPVNFQLQ